MPQNIEKIPLEVAVKTVYGVDDDDVETALGGMAEQALQFRPVGASARDTGVLVDFDQLPDALPGVANDGLTLGV